MKFGVNIQVWVGRFTPAEFSLIEKVREMGFDVMEIIGVENGPEFDTSVFRQAAQAAGLEPAVCAALSPAHDVTSDDPEVRRSGIACLKGLVTTTAAIGGQILCGPLYAQLFKSRHVAAGQRQAERERAVEAFREVGRFAHEQGVTVAVEPLNRFEIDLFNTAEQITWFVRAVDSPAVRILLDTFHMSIEEKDVAQAIRCAGPLLAHFHTCENDRGTPGSGQVHWERVRDALREIGYDGRAVIEGFNPAVSELANGAKVFRPLAPSQDALAADGLRFLRDLFG